MGIFQILTLNQRYGDQVALKVYLDPEVMTYDELRYLTVFHLGFHGCVHVGELIVHESIAEEVLQIFKELYQIRFPIEKMRLMSFYGYSDELAMIDNNSSAFNFRYVKNGKKLSQHAYGLAIDLNPLINPYIEGNLVSPPNGLRYVDRVQRVQGMIKKNDPVYQIFKSYGWDWGGDWTHLKDYHHFEKPFK